MARIEELPDDFDKALSLDTSKSPTGATASAQSSSPPSVPFPIPPKNQDEEIILPAVPPHMDPVRAHTADEAIQLMSKTPLFMTSLDDTADGTLLHMSYTRGLVHLNMQGRRRKHRARGHARTPI